MGQVNRSLNEMDADRKFTGLVHSFTLTDTSLVNAPKYWMIDLGTYSFWVKATLISGTAPTTIDLTFNKQLISEGVELFPELTPLTVSIPDTSILPSPSCIIVNVTDLLPEAVFNSIQLDAQATAGAGFEVKLDVYVVGD